MRQLAACIALGVTLSVAGCPPPSFPIPSTALIECFGDSDCPTDYRCTPEYDRCVHVDDDTPPVLIGFGLSSMVFEVDDTLVVAFEIHEFTPMDPVVYLDVNELERVEFALTSATGFVFTAELTHDGSVPAGFYRVLIEGEDLAGNAGLIEPIEEQRDELENEVELR